MRCSQWLMCGTPSGVLDMVSSIHIPFIYSILSPGCCSLSHSPLLVMQLMTQFSGWDKREMGLLTVSCTAREAEQSLMFSLSPMGEITGGEGSFGTEVCCPGGGVMQVNCSSYPLQCLQSWIFFHSNSVLKLFCFNSWTSTKALSLVCGGLSSWFSLGGRW